jgi:hypothetical protein
MGMDTSNKLGIDIFYGVENLLNLSIKSSYQCDICDLQTILNSEKFYLKKVKRIVTKALHGDRAIILYKIKFISAPLTYKHAGISI